MNCFYHDHDPAVIACAKCGVGLCRNCMNDAVYNIDGKPLCMNCSLSIAQGELDEARKNRMWSLVKFIFSGVFIGIGLLALAGGAGIENVWIISGVAGIPTAFKATRRSREQRIMDEVHDRYEKDLINLLFGWAMRLLIKLAFIILLAPICALFTCISNLISFLRSKKGIKEAEDTIFYIEHHLNGDSDMLDEPLPAAVAQEPVAETESPVAQAQPERLEYASSPAATSAVASPAPAFQPRPSAPSYGVPAQSKKANGKIIGIAVGALALVGLIAGYFLWYIPYAKDRDALRTYVVANNVFLRSSKMAGVEYNVLQTVPYGSELITYAKDAEWAEVKVNGVTGFVASPYILEWNDFSLLNGIWGNTDTKEYIESSKCRLALMDYCKRNGYETGSGAWQLYTLQKEVKPNNVLFPRLTNGYDKFTEFAFLLKNNATQERRFALYSFDEETEKPVFLYEEIAPAEGQIKQVRYDSRRNVYSVNYTGNASASVRTNPAEEDRTHDRVLPPPPEHSPAVEEQLTIVEDEPAVKFVPPVEEKTEPEVETDKLYTQVEEMPEFPNGGTSGLMAYISRNLRYPTICQENKVQGRVVVSFVVNRDGSLSDFVVARSADPYLDKEALRVLKGMPSWKPGKQKGVPVKVRFSIPVTFRLS